MRKYFALFVATALWGSFAVPVNAEETMKTEDTVILYTNDVHTYIDGALSYDVIAALKSELETQYEHVILVDAGDHIQGTAYGSMDKGASIIEMMNAAEYDLATMGNHEIDYGMDGFMNVVSWAEYPYVSCNFYHEKDGVCGETVLDGWKLFECGDEKIAFVGITTPETFSKSSPVYFQDAAGNYIYNIAGGDKGEELYAAVQDAIDEAEQAGATTIIALGHLGDDSASAPWTSEEVIANTCGLDAFIDGHSHSVVEGRMITDEDGHEVILTQTGEYFDRIGMMVIDAETGAVATDFIECVELLDKDGETVMGYELSSELYCGTEVIYDTDVKTVKDGWMAEIESSLEKKIGSIEVGFTNYDEEGNRMVRSQETNNGDFCADALYYLFDNMDMDVDVAIMNGGGIRNKTTINGDISYQTCMEIHTFGNVACLQTVTGQQLLDALEWGAKDVGIGENGGFLQVSGLTYCIDTAIESTVQADDKGIWIGAPTGEYRVHDVKLYNKGTNTWDDLDAAAKYNLAGYNYTLRNLGDGFAMFDGAVNVLDYVMEDYMVLANYVQAFENCSVNAGNSPLVAKYSALMVDYGDVNGSGRITMCEEEKANVTYTVQKGDTLWALSKKHGCTVEDIVSCNGGLIKKPNLIRVGWKLVIPQK